MSDITREEFFDNWLLLDKDNIYLNEVRSRFYDMPNNIRKAVDSLDDYYSLFFLSQTVQMVLGGMKPACDYTVNLKLVELYQQEGLMDSFDTTELSKVLFEFFSVRITEVEDGDYDDNSLRLLVYNPKLIEHISDTHDELRPYRDENIKKWVQNSMYDGINEYFLMGLIYGFPLSSIKQFIKYNDAQSDEYTKGKKINNYGESYMVWGDTMNRDVNIREELKDQFFTELASNDKYLETINYINDKAKKFRDISLRAFEKCISFATAPKDK